MRPLPRHALICVCSSLLLAPRADFAAAQDAKPAPPPVTPFAPKAEPDALDLAVSRADLPAPVFRYRFLPEVGELNPGDAAPVYLRINQETKSEGTETLYARAATWLELPIRDLPVKEAEALLERWSGRLRQIGFGTRRETCRWEYTTREEADDAFSILLPDAQAMRNWGRVLALKARCEIASDQLDRAAGTIETGIAFGRHVAYGPFPINRLVGIAIIEGMLAQASELIARPGAPNFYWALAALPRPLVGIRDAIEVERLAIGTTMTGQPLTSFDPKKVRTDAEWTALLVNLHARMTRYADSAMLGTTKSVPVPDLDGYRRAMLPPARDDLKRRGIEAKTDDQALVLAIMGLYRDLVDDHTKRAYLPFAEAEKLPPVDEAAAAKDAAAGPAAVFAQLLPALPAAQRAEVRLDRRVAMLRTVEALRLYAARHDGQFPDRLDQVREVPVPPDPVTGGPFEYRRDGQKATLSGPPLQGKPLVYNLTLRP